MRNLYSNIEYYYHIYKDLIPEGYICGLVRDPYDENNHVAHLYKGTVENPGDPMCKHGWNRGRYGYSIWRNVIGYRGLCKTCLRRANKNLDPIPFPKEWIEDDDFGLMNEEEFINDFTNAKYGMENENDNFSLE